MFGEDRLVEFVRHHRSAKPSMFIGDLIDEIKRLTGRPEPADDLTVIALRKE